MTQGRPPTWNPFAELAPGVWTEAVQFGSKGRFIIPVAARRRLLWLSDAVAEGLLATLEPGRIARLEPWLETGAKVIRQVEERLELAVGPRRSEIALAAMDRYMRIGLEETGRLAVPQNLLSHIDPRASGTARVVVRDDTLWLWAEDRWQAQASSRLRTLVGQVS
jgi:DNA-binding transcriptional regulator/RsmH inhibitor MraZ